MARLYGEGDKYYFDTQEEPPYILELHEDNLWANMHRDEPMMDRLAIEDPRDGLAWYWWRCDQDPETFEQMMSVALEIGTILVRRTPLESIVDLFDNAHHLDEEDMQRFFDES
jgi:hypothetical protein